MLDRIKLHFQKFDWLIFSSVVLLACFGLVEIYSVALGQGGGDFLNFRKQLVFIFGGVGLLVFFSFIDFRFLKSIHRYIYIGAGLILISVLFLGQTIKGTKGWFSVFGLGIQPVEFVKIALIIFLGWFFSNASFKTRPLKYFILSGLSTFFLVFLVLLQPDFGSSLLLIFIWIFMLLITGFDKKYFLIIFLSAAVIFSVAWFLLFKDYQKQRVMTFLQPTQNSLGSGYNSSQAMIAIGSGGLVGRGVGFGSQSQLKFLPEAQTDFIFAVVSEELGFVGSSLMFLFYGILLFRCLFLLNKINDDFAIFFVLGGVGLIFVEMFINIGMNIGIVPVVGIALPFLSYGGSSILANFVIIGIIENIFIKSKT